MKKKILIIYPEMIIGGTTTSLLSLLGALDRNKYEVDLQMQYAPGIFANLIPSYVHILPLAMPLPHGFYKWIKAFSLKSLYYYLKSKWRGGASASQYMENDIVKFCRKNPKEYDVAISFMERWSLYYLVKKTCAKKKIAWIHVDYGAAKMFIDIDMPFFKKVDKIVLVSEKCLQNFKSIAPEIVNKSLMIENLLSSEVVKQRAGLSVPRNVAKLFEEVEGKVKMVSVCRISFPHKGLDRGVKALARLKKQGKIENLIWFIIGDGPDLNNLKAMVDKFGLNNYVRILGAYNNPLNIEAKCDIFFLPSRYEGKPMAVTEAQMLGLVPIVTNYASASEQVRNFYDGLIMDNSDDGIYDGLEYMLHHLEDVLGKYKNNVANTDYSNLRELLTIEKELL